MVGRHDEQSRQRAWSRSLDREQEVSLLADSPRRRAYRTRKRRAELTPTLWLSDLSQRTCV